MAYFGNMKLKDISTGMLTDFFNSHKTTDKDGVEYPLAPSTAKKLYTILQSIFTFAVNQNYIKETPAKGVIFPSKDVTKDEKHK